MSNSPFLNCLLTAQRGKKFLQQEKFPFFKKCNPQTCCSGLRYSKITSHFMSFLQHKQQKNFSNWSFKYTPKNDYITTPLCCLAYTSPSVQTFRPSELKIMAKLLLHWSTQQIKVTEKYPGYITSHGLAGLHRTDKYFNYPGGPSRYWEETGSLSSRPRRALGGPQALTHCSCWEEVETENARCFLSSRQSVAGHLHFRCTVPKQPDYKDN